ncbi:Gfo/Idh/MocA family oxidoreductase [Microbacterium sp. W1N]|uniref:Gfo/Idh/MocA family protein n=1 Tax=Microbacterium festucae TaxID=2977531 RepID=UPI0021C18994|nr:Gfo/Idh/MocA family oxidoreductase [Microbacterium festucae]MCT9821373.1 Gfo/Idh/MocA family oxidoreductase [Microbacterium festucae]
MAADLSAVAPGAVTAVWGRGPERAHAFAEQFAIPFASDSRAAVFDRDDVDVVYVATPAATHRDIAIAALLAGKHVLIEKPLATSAADAAEIFAAARATGRFAMEAMWMRFNPLHTELRERISDGLIGEVNSVRASFGTPFQARGNVLSPGQGGSILLDRGIYPITLADWFLGAPTSIHAAGAFDDGVDVHGRATLHSVDGFAQLAWSGVEFLDLSATVSGERGWITLDPMFWAGSRARVHAGTVERIFVAPEIVEHPREGNGYRPMLTAVISALGDGRLEHPDHTHEDTLRIARTMDRVLHAMTTST